jgi:alpha-tubulin suppressor-like RCC1 family protein
VACWGEDGDGQSTPPAGTFSQVSAGWYHTCGVKTDGTLACWGCAFHSELSQPTDYGQANPPAGTFLQVGAGYLDSCGIRTDGSLVCWGSAEYAVFTAPAGTFSQLSLHGGACGLRTDGTVSCWGTQGKPPEGQFSQVSFGGNHACAVRANGTVTCWGLQSR